MPAGTSYPDSPIKAYTSTISIIGGESGSVSVPAGSPIRSVLDGRVLFSEWSFETGYVLVVMHNDNLISVYKHSKKNLKSQNEFVKAGEVIAYSGNQGQLRTGPHLHIELWQNGLPVNPEPFFKFN